MNDNKEKDELRQIFSNQMSDYLNQIETTTNSESTSESKKTIVKKSKSKSVGNFLKKGALGAGKTIGSVLLGTVGSVAAIAEEALKIDGGNILSDIAYEIKNESFNGVRKMWGKERKEYDEADSKSSEQMMREYERRKKEYQRRLENERKKLEENKPHISQQEYIARKNKIDIAEKKLAESTFTVKSFSSSNTKRVSYQKGVPNNPTAFVFSCPGQEEMNFGNVCQGTTGVNLSMVLKICHEKRPDVFPYPNKSDYLITNASDLVHYMALTNDTEASDEEILAKDNLDRLRNELSSKKTVICMGERAKKAVSSANISARTVYFAHHLSNQKLNRTMPNSSFDENLSPEERRKARLEFIANELLKIV